MKGFLADVEFMWGFQTRVVGMSKTSPSFQLPPPTTVLGAIAEAYARRRNLSENKSLATMQHLAKNLLALTYKPLNVMPVVYQDLNRIIAIRVSQDIEYPSISDPYGSFDAPARGKTIFSTTDGRPPTLRIFSVFKDTADISVDDLWKIRRIGSKESLVSVVNVVEREPEVLRGCDVSTDYLLPLTSEIEHAVLSVREFLKLEFVPISGLISGEPPAKQYLEYKTLKHIIGMPPFNKKIRVRLPPGYVGYKIEEEVTIGVEG
ncbi:MAG: type I-A CRISPR-associated protein Cas5a [Candidatus Nezhaarchaeales archaeon]